MREFKLTTKSLDEDLRAGPGQTAISNLEMPLKPATAEHENAANLRDRASQSPEGRGTFLPQPIQMQHVVATTTKNADTVKI